MHLKGEVDHGEVGKRGIYRWPDGSVYEGNLQRGMRHGYGRYFDASSGTFYSGNWHYSHMHDYVWIQIQIDRKTRDMNVEIKS